MYIDLTPSTERIGDVIFINENMKGVGVQIALRWSSDSYIETTHGFANGIRTADGGAHLDGFKSAVTKTVNTLARKVSTKREYICIYMLLPLLLQTRLLILYYYYYAATTVLLLLILIDITTIQHILPSYLLI